MLNSKQIEIIEYLFKNSGFITAEYLSKVLNVSTRTIKRYIDAINTELRDIPIEIVSIRGTGCQLKGPPTEIEQLIHRHPFEENKDLRIRQIILNLVDSQTLTIEELSSQIHYSVSTINKLTAAVKDALQKYGLELISRPHYGLTIEGDELNIRSMLVDYGFYIHHGKLYTELLNITDSEFSHISSILLEYLKRKGIVVADRDIHNLLEKIILSVSRIKKQCTLHQLPLQEGNKHPNYDVIYEILDQISQTLMITFTDYEINYISIYSGFIMYSFHPKMINEKNDIQDFVRDTLREIAILFGVDYTEQDLIINYLSIHLNMLLVRLNQDIRLKNPMLKQIKSEYVMEMNYAIFLAKKIEERFHIKISEDELGYLAIYFGTARKQKSTRKRVVILCHYGIGTAQLLGEQIKESFPELEISGIYPIHYIDFAQEQMIDFIISTVAIDDYKGEKPIIIIDNLLSEKSMKSIKTALDKGNQDSNALISFFHPQAWYRIDAKSSTDAILQLSSHLILDGFINEEIKNSVIEREAISSTEIGNLVAIPHTIFTQDYKSIIGVGILNKTIPWDKERVQLIFMLCFNGSEPGNHMIFRQLYKIIKNINTVEKLISSNNFQDFISWMKGGQK